MIANTCIPIRTDTRSHAWIFFSVFLKQYVRLIQIIKRWANMQIHMRKIALIGFMDRVITIQTVFY